MMLYNNYMQMNSSYKLDGFYFELYEEINVKIVILYCYLWKFKIIMKDFNFL